MTGTMTGTMAGTLFWPFKGQRKSLSAIVEKEILSIIEWVGTISLTNRGIFGASSG